MNLVRYLIHVPCCTVSSTVLWGALLDITKAYFGDAAVPAVVDLVEVQTTWLR